MPLVVMVTPEADGHPTERIVFIKMVATESEMINSNTPSVLTVNPVLSEKASQTVKE